MIRLKEKIITYWHKRAEGYSVYNQEELAGMKWQVWLEEITRYLPDKEKKEIHILDIGTGPGFFAILLAREGYRVTAIDCTKQMLAEAEKNAGTLAGSIHFQVMDAQQLEFKDNTFDMVVSRNLTWVLEEPEKAYKEWHRVLKNGGVLVNFDANWYRYLYDDEMRRGYEKDRMATKENQVRDEYVHTDIDAMEAIAKEVPLSKVWRPDWDEHVLKEIGFTATDIDPDVWQQVLTEEEKINYASTPIFKIAAIKS